MGFGWVSRCLPLLLPLLLIVLTLLPGTAAAQGYGSTGGWRVVFRQDEAAGLTGGARAYAMQYGSRRLTWKRRAEITALASVRGGAGAELLLGQRIGRSPAALVLAAGASRRLRSFRFYGYGNDRPAVAEEHVLVPLDERWVEARLEVELGASSTFTVGSVVERVVQHADPRGPLMRSGAPGSGTFTLSGALASFAVAHIDDAVFPRSGIQVTASGAVYPGSRHVLERFGTVDVDLRGYVPLPLKAVLAGRGGARVVEGKAPVHEAAFLGGAESLRGYSRQRFAGDAGVWVNAELRVPLLALPLPFIPGRLGVIGFTDAGRVYVADESPGGWHGSSGAGAWYQTSRATVTALYARGEDRLLHLYLGLPF
jgi:hypothetical protein